MCGHEVVVRLCYDGASVSTGRIVAGQRGWGAVLVRKGGQRIVRAGPSDNRPGVEDQAVQAAGRDVSSSHDTVQRAVLIRPRTIWLVTAIIAGLAVAWVVVGRSFDVWALVFIGIVLAEGMRPLVHGLCARGLPRSIAVLLLYGVVLAVLGLL